MLIRPISAAISRVLQFVEALRLDVHNIADAADDAVAQRVRREADGVAAFEAVQIHLRGLFAHHHRPDLQEMELRRSLGTLAQVNGKFDLDRPAHGFLGELEKILDEAGERKSVVFQHAGKGDQPGARAGQAVNQLVVLGVVDGGQSVKSVILFGVLQGEFDQGGFLVFDDEVFHPAPCSAPRIPSGCR